LTILIKEPTIKIVQCSLLKDCMKKFIIFCLVVSLFSCKYNDWLMKSRSDQFGFEDIINIPITNIQKEKIDVTVHGY
jgi:hypothetical protein